MAGGKVVSSGFQTVTAVTGREGGTPSEMKITSLSRITFIKSPKPPLPSPCSTKRPVELEPELQNRGRTPTKFSPMLDVNMVRSAISTVNKSPPAVRWFSSSSGRSLSHYCVLCIPKKIEKNLHRLHIGPFVYVTRNWTRANHGYSWPQETGNDWNFNRFANRIEMNRKWMRNEWLTD